MFVQKTLLKGVVTKLGNMMKIIKCLAFFSHNQIPD